MQTVYGTHYEVTGGPGFVRSAFRGSLAGPMSEYEPEYRSFEAHLDEAIRRACPDYVSLLDARELTAVNPRFAVWLLRTLSRSYEKPRARALIVSDGPAAAIQMLVIQVASAGSVRVFESAAGVDAVEHLAAAVPHVRGPLLELTQRRRLDDALGG